MTMNPQDLLDTLAGGMADLKVELRALSLANCVKEFSGERPEELKSWLKQMEKAGAAVAMEATRMKILALQSLTEPASSFCTRFLKANADAEWDDLRQAMWDRYSDPAEKQLASIKLKHATQGSDETVQNYADRVIELSEEAYEAQELRSPILQTQLRDIFIDGLKDDNMVRKLMRQRPDGLADAVDFAIMQQSTDRAFAVRRGEPMEIDNIRRKKKDQVSDLSDKVDKLADNVSRLLQINSISTPRTSDHARPNYQSRHKWTKDGKPICSFCNKTGHLSIRCYKRLAQESTQGNESARS